MQINNKHPDRNRCPMGLPMPCWLAATSGRTTSQTTHLLGETHPDPHHRGKAGRRSRRVGVDGDTRNLPKLMIIGELSNPMYSKAFKTIESLKEYELKGSLVISKSNMIVHWNANAMPTAVGQ
jgi:hypothetical protein